MKRLTYWNEEYDCWSYHGPSGDAAKHLAAYEDTGLDPEAVEQLKLYTTGKAMAQIEIRTIEGMPLGDVVDLIHAKREGLLVAPPCKVGDTVYIPDYAKIVVPVKVQGISITASGKTILHFGGYPVWHAWGDEVGKTFFLAREEAEAALKGGEDRQ